MHGKSNFQLNSYRKLLRQLRSPVAGVRISPLTHSAAAASAEPLLRIHNQIPFQYWRLEHLLADRDPSRVFRSKWKVSQVARLADQPVGLCVAFLNNNLLGDITNTFLYIHRLAVDLPQRRRHIATRLIIVTAIKALIITGDGNLDIIVQTPTLDYHSGSRNCTAAIQFYRSLGFRKIGTKAYVDRVDSVLKTKWNDVAGLLLNC